MPQIYDLPPALIQRELEALSVALDQQIPAKSVNNFLVATWNIRVFASLTRKWTASSSDSPKRDLRGLRAIIEILRRFDVIAIQEIKGNLRALRDTIKFLRREEDWGLLMTDVNTGNLGHDERFAFLFDRSRVIPSGLAAELVVPPDRKAISPDALQTQFARPPYAVSFQRGSQTVIMTTLHVYYGKTEADRLRELNEIADWMYDWARRSNRYHHNLLTLGDFNIDRAGSPGYEAFISTGLRVPDALMNLPRTIYDNPADPSDKFYDQIAWFNTGRKALIDLHFSTGGSFDFLPYMYTDLNLSKSSLSYRISDHYPLWVEFFI